MYKTAHEYENALCKIISAAAMSKNIFNYTEIIPGIDPQEYSELLYNCKENNYIINLENSYRDSGGNAHVSKSGTPRATHEGLQFIEYVQRQNSAEIASNANTKSDKAKITAYIAIVISSLGLLSQIFANLDKIVSNVEWAISYLNLQELLK